MNDIILNSEQEKAVKTEHERVLLIAGAGSGKTRVLVERIAHLIENKNVSPYEIAAFTFTRKAAQEITTRLEKRLGGKAFKITTGTQHAVALNFIQRFGELIGLKPKTITVYNQWESDFLLKEVAKELSFHDGYKWKGVKKGNVYKILEKYNTDMIVGYEFDEFYNEISIIDAFHDRCKENNALTYDSILYQFHKLLPKIQQYLGFKHIMVDEVQDNNKCHPPGTLIRKVIGRKGGVGLKYETKNVPIETLKDGDYVVAWTRTHAKLRKRGRKIKTGKRYFKGNLIKVTCNEKSVLVTPDHKFYAMMNGDESGLYAIYLMWKDGYGFRIGKCSIVYCEDTKHKPLNGVGVRFGEEKADKCWILETIKSSGDALVREQIISYNYKIPQIRFIGHIKKSSKMKKIIYNNIISEGLECLRDYKLLFDNPLYERFEKKGRKLPSKRYFETTASNLLPNIMYLPGHKSKQQEKITKIEHIPYSGYVYSMDVEKDHTYLANDIIVKNCQWDITNKMTGLCDASLFVLGDINQSIYSFRGATPEYLINNQGSFDVLKLKNNYRSDANIVEAANRLIKHNAQTIELEMVAVKEKTNEIYHFDGCDSMQLLKMINGIEDKNGVSVLARNHFMLEKLSNLLDESNIKHEYIGKQSKMVHNEDFIRFNAFLKLIVNPNDNFAFLLIKDILGIDKEAYADIRVKASEGGRSHYNCWSFTDAINEGPDWKKWFRVSKKDDMDTVIDWLKFVDFKFDIDKMLDFVYLWRLENLDKGIDDYLNWLSTFDIQDEIKEDSKGLQLMTIHAAKGLEFETVIIAGLNETILPSKQAIVKGEIEDERRLAYVAITRAEDQLILTSRPFEEDLFEIKNPVSRFVKESL